MVDYRVNNVLLLIHSNDIYWIVSLTEVICKELTSMPVLENAIIGRVLDVITDDCCELQASGLHAAPCRHGTTRRVVRRLAGFGRVRPHEVAGNDDGVVDFV